MIPFYKLGEIKNELSACRGQGGKRMTEKTFMAGFGGQGIISLGQLWVYCAMKEGLEVTFFPFYGAEKRGGIARASVVVSSSEIASPLVTSPDSCVVMNEDSLPICEGIARPGALMLVNSSLVKSEAARGRTSASSRCPATSWPRRSATPRSPTW